MLKVLVVDDDPDLLEMVALSLQGAGMDVLSISDAVLLNASVESFQPACILMDIYLGPFDGRTLCHDLKTLGPAKDIPVILYSAGHIDNASITESLCEDFISKPFDTAQLLQKIRLLSGDIPA